ncbi:MAG TPA: MmgE/PrpD family protein [Xanthobacteraceae bacterium]|jgi:2-methylcitrate dehydratase PrpD|nr:MmgE/PrpD family protein [Xanthobacteraceae bacterium]
MTTAAQTMTAAQKLADFATKLQFEQIPPAVVERAKDCMIDIVGVCAFGSTVASSKPVLAYAEQYGAGGRSTVLGTSLKLQAPMAALANGVFAHSFEMDNLVSPSVGVHPGASLLPPGLAVAEEIDVSGREFITAFVAGFEAMHRIGDAALESVEKLGFHAPGVTGPFGGAIIAGRLLKLNAEQMTNALGIAGSLAAGVLEFAKSGGGTVKRMHLGHGAQSGVMAATMARSGFAGPTTILEGKFGYLNVFCRDGAPDRLTVDLGQDWRTMRVMFKRYSCHITAHVPVTAVLALKSHHGFTGDDVAGITVAGSEKMLSHHNIPEPRDLAMAQYSTPFCVALASYADPRDPSVVSETSLNDPAIRALCRNVKLELRNRKPGQALLGSRVTVKLKDGREFVEELENFPGTPDQPLDRAGLREKFETITAGVRQGRPAAVFDAIAALDSAPNVGALSWRV